MDLLLIKFAGETKIGGVKDFPPDEIGNNFCFCFFPLLLQDGGLLSSSGHISPNQFPATAGTSSTGAPCPSCPLPVAHNSLAS